jgi:hypothetical protein
MPEANQGRGSHVCRSLLYPRSVLVEHGNDATHDVAAHHAEGLKQFLLKPKESLASRGVEEGQNAFLDLGLEQSEGLANEPRNLRPSFGDEDRPVDIMRAEHSRVLLCWLFCNASIEGTRGFL